MNQEIKARWVTWLRANADKQTHGRLRIIEGRQGKSAPGFCCLGGLCELAIEDGVISSRVLENDHLGTIVSYGSDRERTLSEMVNSWSHTALPGAVVEWADLGHFDPYIILPQPYGRSTLTYINDDMKYDFNQIADLIEEQL